MLKNDTLKNRTSRIDLYGSAPRAQLAEKRLSILVSSKGKAIDHYQNHVDKFFEYNMAIDNAEQ